MALISDVTVGLVSKMLDLQNLRASVASENIANANVTGYAPREADFQTQLETLRGDLAQPDALVNDLQALGDGTSTIRPEASASLLGAAVNLDGEVTTLTVANTQYESLVASLNRHFGLLRLAITGQE